MNGVMFVINKLEQGGGTETHLFTLVKKLQTFGYKIGVFTSGGPWIKYFRKQGIHVYMCQPKVNVNKLKSILEKKEYGILHVHDSEGFKLAKDLSMIYHIPVIMTVHGLYVAPERIQECASISQAVIAVSAEVQRYIRYYCGVSISKIHTILNGIEISKFYKINPNRARKKYGLPVNSFVIGYAGRFTLDKGDLSHRICKTIEKLSKNNTDTYVLIAGRNSQQFFSKQSNVISLGHVTDMPGFYNACSAVVGTGRVAMEALSCTIPTIAVGVSRYIGLISSQNLNIAIESNFGDHVRSQMIWYDDILEGELRYVREHENEVGNATEKLNKLIRVQFSATRMVNMIHALYQNLSD